ncbi:helix-turn-helix transcriptional regulator [Krasilnikovia sp. MM14-A1259]|uniref:helix-turn-helix transcriptional regulator n=1 Tax=Krasilnikovia sp. MM14-A1259 TaxID=3373539 RepID=UPI003828AF13
MTDADAWLDPTEAAALAGVAPSTWRSYVSRGYAPAPDDPDSGSAPQRRRPRWRTSAVEAFRIDRRGQGTRSDLSKARAARAQQLAAELAAPVSAPSLTLQGWLADNHHALLHVAELLIDHRDELLAASPAGERDNLTEAIDHAGEQISHRPSRALAAAVAYALYLLRADGPVRIPAGSELRQTLTHQQRLRDEYTALRGH